MNPEQPVPTEAQQILRVLHDIDNELHDITTRLDAHAQGINTIGEQVNWLTENTKGIFAFMSSPMFTSQLMGAVGGLLPGMGVPDDGADRHPGYAAAPVKPAE